MIPYTYLIKHNPSGQVYYGVRFAKGCHPDDLWVTYFTSSRYVKDLIKRDGIESFSTQIRKTFDSRDRAIAWENKVLRRMLSNYDPCKWLNKTTNAAILEFTPFVWTAEKRRAHSEKLKLSHKLNPRRHSEKTKQKLSRMRRGVKGTAEGNAAKSKGHLNSKRIKCSYCTLRTDASNLVSHERICRAKRCIMCNSPVRTMDFLTCSKACNIEYRALKKQGLICPIKQTVKAYSHKK